MGRAVGSILRTKFFIDQFTKMIPFQRKCQRPLEVQREFLERLLRTHEDTEFGKKYRFGSIRTIRDFQKRVPVHAWDKIVPYVQKVIDGRPSALFSPSEKILMFAATSGTTGQPKYVPVTESSYQLYGRYWDHTWSNVARRAPFALSGKALYFPGDPEEGYLGTVPYGAITAKAYAQQNPLTKTLYPYPFQVARIKDYQLRYYTIMRVALEADIRIIPIANPSTIITLFKTARERAEEMIEDIEQGSLRDSEQIPEELRDMLVRQLRPNPRRAEELREILRRTGDFLPRDYWFSPMSVICFASGPMKLYLKQLPNYLEHFFLVDFGLLASEGRLSFPLDTMDRQKGCCLTLESNFFEFLPEEEMDRKNPEVLTLDQVEEGKNYFILFSNASGLYRYNISDLVRVNGFFEKVPLISFCNKGKHYASITGEKLSEYQITETVRKAGEKVGYHLDDFVVCLHWDDENPSYSLLKAKNGNDNPRLLEDFVSRVDEELMEMNVEYLSKRKSMRLGPLTLKIVKGNGYQEYESGKQRKAHNLSQYKHTFLVADPDFEKQFQFSREISSSVKLT
jgi:GH3 auxin-responsive promoter